MRNTYKFLEDCVLCEREPPPPNDPIPDEVYEFCDKEFRKPVGLTPEQEEGANKKMKDQGFDPKQLLPFVTLLLESAAAVGLAILAALAAAGSLAGV